MTVNDTKQFAEIEQKSAVFDWKPICFYETLNLMRRLTIKSLAAPSTQNKPILLNFSQLFLCH